MSKKKAAKRKKERAQMRLWNRALFQMKSVRIFPARSFVYAFFAAVLLFFGLLAADRASGYDQLINEDFAGVLMNLEKLDTGLKYPLMAIRGREEIRQGQAKILVVGDSFVWGEGLTNLNQIWWNVMARELERRGWDCEVYAAGAPGASTYYEFAMLRDTSLLEDIQPDLIILGYVTNDVDLRDLDARFPEYESTRQMYSRVMGSYHIRLQAGKKKLAGGIFYNMNAYNTRRQVAGEYKDMEEDRLRDDRLEVYNRDVLQPMGGFFARTGIPMIVIPTPEGPRAKNYALLYRDVLPLFERAGFPVYNPLDKFKEKYPNRKPNKYFRANATNPHPGPATSWFLGAYAADVVEQNYAAVLGAKRTEEKTYPIEINDWMPYMLQPRALQESDRVSRYAIEYPDQSSRPNYEDGAHGNFLILPLREKYVKLNLKYPVRLSSVKIEGGDLLSCEVWTLGINRKLGFDDQTPVSLGHRKGNACAWEDDGQREVTSLLVSAKTTGGKQAVLTITIEGEVNM